MESSELLSLEEKIGKERELPREVLLLRKKRNREPEQFHTFKLPKSKVLAQAKKFLPEMAQAEAQLTEELKLRDSTEFDIENVQGVQKYVEMNVKLVKLEESESDTENENGCDSESTQTSSDCDCEGDSDTAERKMKNVAGMSERDSNIKPHRMVELVTEALDEK